MLSVAGRGYGTLSYICVTKAFFCNPPLCRVAANVCGIFCSVMGGIVDSDMVQEPMGAGSRQWHDKVYTVKVQTGHMVMGNASDRHVKVFCVLHGCGDFGRGFLRM